MSTDDLRRGEIHERLLADAAGWAWAFEGVTRRWRSLVTALATAYADHALRQRYRQSARELLTFDDRSLSDIGMRRTDVEWMLRTGRWPDWLE